MSQVLLWLIVDALTTLNSSFGRFSFTSVSFGLCVSQDRFQQKMNFILEKFPGTVGMADDIAVHGPKEGKHMILTHTTRCRFHRNMDLFSSWTNACLRRQRSHFLESDLIRKGYIFTEKSWNTLRSHRMPKNFNPFLV